MSGLTPKMWGVVKYHNGEFGIETNADPYIAGTHEQIAVVWTEPNARLIAAAPEMLLAITQTVEPLRTLGHNAYAANLAAVLVKLD